ncbi:MAG: hypothetical protein ABJE95_31850 [Byssovorax sp.]
MQSARAEKKQWTAEGPVGGSGGDEILGLVAVMTSTRAIGPSEQRHTESAYHLCRHSGAAIRAEAAPRMRITRLLPRSLR